MALVSSSISCPGTGPHAMLPRTPGEKPQKALEGKENPGWTMPEHSLTSGRRGWRKGEACVTSSFATTQVLRHHHRRPCSPHPSPGALQLHLHPSHPPKPVPREPTWTQEVPMSPGPPLQPLPFNFLPNRACATHILLPGSLGQEEGRTGHVLLPKLEREGNFSNILYYVLNVCVPLKFTG